VAWLYPPATSRRGDEFGIKKPVDLVIAFMAAMVSPDAMLGQAPTADKDLVHLRYAVHFCWAAHKKLLRALCYTVVLIIVQSLG
jgi:hypothetical protein